MEHTIDRLTGAAGPVFVTLAIILLSIGIVCFFEVIQPSIRWPLVTTPIDVLIAFNLIAQYYFVCTVKPGFVDEPAQVSGEGFFWAKKFHITRAHVTRCKRCGQLRPERAHHCRLSLKWINQCVGIYNERYFVLFMVYLVLSTFCFSILGYEKMWEAIGFSDNWPHWTPEILFTLIYILSVVLCFAVGIMCLWHLHSISIGETSVEGHDHSMYRKVAESRGETFINCFDLGKLENLQLFFSIGPGGYPYWTLLFPFRVIPYTDGRSWARRPGYEYHKGEVHCIPSNLVAPLSSGYINNSYTLNCKIYSENTYFLKPAC
ncbi:zf-DHHC-domain-containing [Pyrrhoderma noxium]|uniref:Palmitoyltransferase n=1 Tax=Pyrrhoderma noxium TaxID=2282107 RepID=A0A286U9Z5_9AGAM|nr:zf-DHHC-domain-containing [Pyrrhoderma noxium]